MKTPQNSFSYLASLGISVFPVVRGDKKPATKWSSYQTTLATKSDIELWEAGEFNVGVACGRLSNLLVIDIDSDDAQRLFDTFDAPPTPTVRTAKGRHYYFRLPAGEFRNRVHIGDVGLDVRAEGGYVVGPGSLHPSGVTYEWEVSPEEAAFAEVPSSLIDIIASKPRFAKARESNAIAVRSGTDDNRFSAFIGDRLEEGIAKISQAQEGERNDTLNRVAYYIATMVSSAQLDWSYYHDKIVLAARATGLHDDEITSTLESAWNGGQRDGCPWIDTAQRYVYISKRDLFYNVTAKEGIGANAFIRTHNSERQWEKGNIATILTDHDFIEKAFDLRFDPSQPTGIYSTDSQKWLNTYVDPGIDAVEGDASPFIDFVEHLVPSESEREHLLKMVAWTVRNPSQKLGHALLLRTPRQGVGKSMLIAIWRKLLGETNTRLTTSEQIVGQFQSYIEGNLLVVVEELNFGVGPQAYNRIKNLITGDTAEVNEKFVSSRERPNFATFVFLTNLAEPILIEASDRRFFYIDSPATPRESEYYSQFADWWKQNLGVVRAYIDTIDLSKFNPFAPPPQTEAKLNLQAAARPPLEQELMDAISERRWPFSRDILRLEEVKASIPTALTATPQKLKTAMRNVGAIPLGQHRVPGEWFTSGGRPTFIGGQGTKPSLWAACNVEFWELADPQRRVEEFMRVRAAFEALDECPFALTHARSIPELYRELSSS